MGDDRISNLDINVLFKQHLTAAAAAAATTTATTTTTTTLLLPSVEKNLKHIIDDGQISHSNGNVDSSLQ